MAPKNIVIFGATGMTGKVTLTRAVDAGYNMTVLALDPENLPADKKPTRVIAGNVLNKEDVSKAVEGQDAVIIVLGTNNNLGTWMMQAQAGARKHRTVDSLVIDFPEEMGFQVAFEGLDGGRHYAAESSDVYSLCCPPLAVSALRPCSHFCGQERAWIIHSLAQLLVQVEKLESWKSYG